MTQDEVAKLKPGIYRVWWEEEALPSIAVFGETVNVGGVTMIAKGADIGEIVGIGELARLGRECKCPNLLNGHEAGCPIVKS